MALEAIAEELELVKVLAQVGGLLLCIPPQNLDPALAVLKEKGAPCAEVIGEMKVRGDDDIEVR